MEVSPLLSPECHEVHFLVACFANAHLIAAAQQLHAYDVFKHLVYSVRIGIAQGLTNTLVDQVEFLVEAQSLLADGVLALDAIDEAGCFRRAKISVNRLNRNFAPLGLEVRRDICGRECVSDLLDDVAQHPGEQIRIAHADSLNDIFKEHRGIDPFDVLQRGGLLKCEFALEGETALNEESLECRARVCGCKLVKSGQVFLEGERVHRNLYIASGDEGCQLARKQVGVRTSYVQVDVEVDHERP